MVRIRHKVGQRGLRATQHGRRWWTWSWRRSRIFLRLWTLGWLGGVYTCVLVYIVYTCVYAVYYWSNRLLYASLWHLCIICKSVKSRKINRSSEGRPIHSVTVGGKDKEEGGGCLVWIFCIFCILFYILDIGGRLVWIICGLHAREWMSVLACIHILQALIQVKRSYFLAWISLLVCNERQTGFVSRSLHQTLTSKSLTSKLSHWQIPMATSSRCSMKTTTTLKTAWRGRTWGTQAAQTHSAVGSTWTGTFQLVSTYPVRVTVIQ